MKQKTLKRFKKATAAALAGSIALGIAGCAGESGSDPTPDNGGKNSTEEVTLTAFVQQSVSGESGIWEGWGAKKLYDDLNIKIDFYPTGNEVEQKLNQYLAGGILPDIIGFKGLDQAQLAMDADMLLPLNEYKDKLPSIFETEQYQDAVQYSMDETSNGTGNLYIMPTGIGPAGYNSYNWVPQLQWDVYKKIGKPQPETLEDYLDIVEEMVKEKPVTENGEKVYGFSLFSDWDKYTALEVSTLSFFYGIDTEYVSPLMETSIIDKTTKSILEDDSFYKRALKFYYEANQRGLLDPDSMTQTYSNVDAKYSAGRVMFSYFSWMTGNYNSPASGHVNDPENPDGYAPVLASDMKIYEAPDQTIGRNWYFAISKDCKDIDSALAFLNWLYDPEIDAYLTNGPEGVTWEYKEDGEPHIIDWNVIDKKTEPVMNEEIGGGCFQDGVYPFNTLGISGAVKKDDGYTISYSYWPETLERNMTEMKKEVNEWQGVERVLAEYVEREGLSAKSTQAVNMIPPISDELEMTVSQVGEIVKKYSWQMVYAKDEAEFETCWDSMVEEAYGVGMQEIVDYYETEWEKALDLVSKYE